MTAKADLLQAARSLANRGGTLFSPVELIAEARRHGCTYPDITLRSMLIYHLRVDEGRAPAGQGFERVSGGLYRLSRSTLGPQAVQTAETGDTCEAVQDSSAPSVSRDWTWEGNVQSSVVRYLVGEGWDIVRVADTASREHGFDVEAQQSGSRLLVEVKGYPSGTYRNGPEMGKQRRYNPATQARTYFGNALLAGLIMRSEHPDASIVLAFPAVPTYEGLCRRTAAPLNLAGVGVWLVAESGAVVPVAASS